METDSIEFEKWIKNKLELKFTNFLQAVQYLFFYVFFGQKFSFTDNLEKVNNSNLIFQVKEKKYYVLSSILLNASFITKLNTNTKEKNNDKMHKYLNDKN